MIKTTTKTISFELPASITALTAGLDPHVISPPLAIAEREANDARARLETARADLQKQQMQAEHLAFDAAQGGNAAAYAQAHVALGPATTLIATHEEMLTRAEQRVAAARDAAREASYAEVRRRQAVFNEAGRVLLTELQKLDVLERSLHEAAARLPIAAGAPPFYPGTYRDQEDALRRGAA